jgi:hypothetical protein
MRALSDVIMNIPFDVPSDKIFSLDFSDMRVPYYVQEWFKLSILYVDDTYPLEAFSCVFSPKRVVTFILIIKKKYEDYLIKWQEKKDVGILNRCYRRRELYCHETCHLIAIIRAFPSNRSLRERDEFVEKLKRKMAGSFYADLNMAANCLISQDGHDDSPSDFGKDHFSYEGDSLNYFKLYAELMLPYDRLYEALKKIYETKGKDDSIFLEEISQETLVPPSFFIRFPEKKAEITEILKEGFD